MQRYNLVIIKTWKWYMPWKPPVFGTQEAKPVDSLWPVNTYCFSAEVEALELKNDQLEGSLRQTSEKLRELTVD